MGSPFVKHNDTQHETSQYDDEHASDASIDHRTTHTTPSFRRGLKYAIPVCIITWAVLAAAGIWLVSSRAQPGHAPEPIKAPESLLKARQACPNDSTLVECRSALVRALKAIEWQRSENLKLARQMLGNVTAWTCIHPKEGAWNSNTGNGYFGGLQMDRGFMRTYGPDMIRKHHAWADKWTPREQIIVAQRAYAQGRGYAPWPATSHACGLR